MDSSGSARISSGVHASSGSAPRKSHGGSNSTTSNLTPPNARGASSNRRRSHRIVVGGAACRSTRALQSHELAAGGEGREALVDGGLTVADEVLRALSGVHVVRPGRSRFVGLDVWGRRGGGREGATTRRAAGVGRGAFPSRVSPGRTRRASRDRSAHRSAVGGGCGGARGDSGRPRGRRRAREGRQGASGWVADREGRGGVNGTGAWRVPEGRRGVSGGVSGGAYPATTGGVPLAESATSGLPDAARRARCRFSRSTSPPGMPYRRRQRPPHVRATPPPDTTRVSESPRARVSLREAARNRLAHRFHRFPTP